MREPNRTYIRRERHGRSELRLQQLAVRHRVYLGNGDYLNGGYADSNQLAAVRDMEVFPSYVTTHTARDAFKNVLSDVGCNRPVPM